MRISKQFYGRNGTVAAAAILVMALAPRLAAAQDADNPPLLDYLADLAIVLGAAPGGEEQGSLAASAANDARDLGELLARRSRVQLTVKTGPAATRKAFEEAVAAMRAAKSKSGRVVVYLSGAVAVHKGKLVFLAADSQPGKPKTGLPVDRIIAQLAEAGFKQQILVLDGSAMAEPPAGVDQAQIDLTPAHDIVVLVAVPPAQKRATKEILLHSPFTRAWIDTWRDPNLTGKDGWTWLPRVLAEVQGANDPNAAPPRVMLFSKMKNAGKALWLDVPLLRSVPKAGTGAPNKTERPEEKTPQENKP